MKASEIIELIIERHEKTTKRPSISMVAFT